MRPTESSKPRTIFAQSAMKPEMVRQELTEARRALGSYGDVARFTRDAVARLGAPLGKDDRGHATLSPGPLPLPVREAAGFDGTTPIGFHLPDRSGVTHIGRTSPLVEALGAYLTDTALDDAAGQPGRPQRRDAHRSREHPHDAPACCVSACTSTSPAAETTEPLLAEEAMVAGYRGRGESVEWLADDEAERLLDAVPAANVPREQAILWLRQSLADLTSQPVKRRSPPSPTCTPRPHWPPIAGSATPPTSPAFATASAPRNQRTCWGCMC